MGRIIMITGKGGVGKTSVAAAHAAASAREGKNTLLVSADMAHNLGDIFQVEVGRHVKKVRENLSLLELDPDLLMQEEFPLVNKAIISLMSGDDSSAEKVGNDFMIPGFENLFSLLKIRDLYESGEYDRIIVDCAPTGETLSLLKMPELLTWYMEKFFPVGKVMVRVLSPVAKAKYKVTLPETPAMDEMEQMHRQLVALQDLLRDPDVCRVRIVCVPEKMIVEETKRNYMYLHLYGYHVDGAFINRILPEQTGSAFMNRWHEIQKKYLEELEHLFVEIPVTKIPWHSEEIRGGDAIDSLTDDITKQPGLFDRTIPDTQEVYEACEGGYCLSLTLPHVNSDEVAVTPHDCDIDIKINNYNRCIPLPGALRGMEVTGVTWDDHRLQINFSGKDVRQS